MKKIVKQVVGIDVAQKELVVSLGRMYDDLDHRNCMHTKLLQILKRDFRHWYHGYKS